MRENKRNLFIRAVFVALGAATADFLWQLCFDQDWLEAAKISYFQAFSLIYFSWDIS